MSFDLHEFARTRPFQHHLTAAANLCRIRRMRRLDSAAKTFAAAGRLELSRCRRTESCLVRVGDEDVHVRDQKPLHRNHMELDRGWSFECFVQKLNELVFFWPGKEDGRPIPHGCRHFKRYQGEDVAMIRVKTKSLFDANKNAAPRFSRYNSGSPRHAHGKPSSRGEQTFMTADVFPARASKVVETVYSDFVILPEDSELGAAPGGPWEPFLVDVASRHWRQPA